MKFKVGDVVRCIKKYSNNIKVGMTGTIVHYMGVGNIGIEWNEPISTGHDCERHCTHNKGYYVPHIHIELLNINWRDILWTNSKKETKSKW